MRIAVSCRSLAGIHYRPEFLHLHELVDLWQTHGHEVTLIGSSQALDRLPGEARRVILEPGTSVWNRVRSLIWGEAPSAAKAGGEVLFIIGPLAPLVAPLPLAVMPGRGGVRPTSTFERIHAAAGQAGWRGASAVLTLDDLPPIGGRIRSVRVLPAFVGSAFTPQPEKTDGDRLRKLGLAPGYCLAFGGSPDDVQILLAAWSWVAGALGDEYPLVILGGGGIAADLVRALATKADVARPARWIGRVSADDVPALFRGADAFLHAGSTSIGQELRWALACGVPIAGVETPETAAVVGEAGYMVPAFDTRSLGAACLTVIVETQVADKLRQRGLARAGAYHQPSSRQAWADVFQTTA